MPLVNTTIYNEAELEPMYRPQDAVEFPVRLVPSASYAAGTVLGIVTASGLHAAYNNALATGVETARCILRYPVTVDAAGNHLVGEQNIGTSAPAFYEGFFATEDLTGLDAAAITDLGGRLLWGTTSNGVLRF